MRKKMKAIMKAFIVSIGCILAFSSVMNAKAETMYSEGYFHYVVEKNAVKITEYFGTQNEVTVPPMIAGYPVEIIATGVFADNQMVQKVNLPDTITVVEERAFGNGQTVVYDSNTEEPQITLPEQNDSSNESSNDNQESEGGTLKEDMDSQEALLPTQNTLVDHLGRVISVDEQKRLIATDLNGKVTILDDSTEYKKITEKDGTTHITNVSGKIVTVDDNGEVKITDKVAGNKKLSVIIISGGLIVLLVLVMYYMHRRKRNERND